MKIKTFDIECYNDITEFNDEQIKNSGFGLGVIYDHEHEFYQTFNKEDVNDFINELIDSDLIVSFNGKRFDIMLLEPYMTKDQQNALNQVKHFDILEQAFNYFQGKFRVPLSNFVEATLNYKMDKTLGKLSPGYIRSGEKDKLEMVKEYCKKDVETTVKLFEFLQENGYLLYYDVMKKSIERAFLPIESVIDNEI